MEKVKKRRERPLPPGADAELIERIRELCEKSGLKQQGLAKQVGLSQNAISKWLSGKSTPSTKSYSMLGQLSPTDALAKYFAAKAIDSSPGIRGMIHVADDEKQDAKRARRAIAHSADVALVPLLKDAAAAGIPRAIRDDEIDQSLSFPAAWVPHPDFTRCVRVKGDSMSPVLEEGYIVAVDTYNKEPRDLVSSMVAARDPEGGITIKWLRKAGKEFILVSHHTSVRHNPVILREDPRWKIIGRVLFWIGRL